MYTQILFRIHEKTLSEFQLRNNLVQIKIQTKEGLSIKPDDVSIEEKSYKRRFSIT